MLKLDADYEAQSQRDHREIDLVKLACAMIHQAVHDIEIGYELLAAGVLYPQDDPWAEGVPGRPETPKGGWTSCGVRETQSIPPPARRRIRRDFFTARAWLLNEPCPNGYTLDPELCFEVAEIDRGWMLNKLKSRGIDLTLIPGAKCPPLKYSEEII